MLRTPAVLSIVGVAVLMAPRSVLEALGAQEAYESELLRYAGAVLACHGIVVAHAMRRSIGGHGRRALPGGTLLAIALAVYYVVSGDGLLLILLFCALVGTTLSVLMAVIDDYTGRLLRSLE